MTTSEIEAVIRAAVEQTKRSIWLRPAVDPIPTDRGARPHRARDPHRPGWSHDRAGGADDGHGKVYVLEIYDRYGDQYHVSVHRTEEGARKRLHRFVQQYWMVRRKIPRKREEAIAVFFEEVDKGDYCIRPYDLEE